MPKIHKKSFIRKEMNITKKSGVDYQHRASADLQYLRYGSDYMQCSKCKEFLGIWHCVRSALFKKRGCEYMIICKRCGYGNKRVKGALSKELDKNWLDEEPSEEEKKID